MEPPKKKKNIRDGAAALTQALDVESNLEELKIPLQNEILPIKDEDVDLNNNN
jgi:hypothetical protein